MSTPRTPTPFANRLLWILLGVLAVTVGLHILLQYLNLAVFDQQQGQIYELSNRFDLDDEASVPTWLSMILYVLLSASAFLAATVQANRSLRRLWLGIGAIGLLFSVDEVATLHEFALQTIHVVVFQNAAPTGLANAWLVIAPFIIVAAAWLLWRMVRVLPRRTIVLFIVAGATFFMGAVITDLLISISSRDNFLNQGVYVTIEETLEFLGIITALYTIVSYIESHNSAALRKLAQQLRALATKSD